MSLSVAYSPCPNDTFVFHALAHGLIPQAPPIQVTYADVDVTNTAALDGRYDLVKVSYAALPWLLDRYALLPCGGAVGRGCGPLILTRPSAVSRPSLTDRPDAAPADAQPTELDGAVVAVPGERTTAYLLLRLWAQGAAAARIEVVPFHQIMPGVAAGRYDAGLVIHEARFTYPRFGLTALVDLGAWWESHTGLPIPLGAILAHRERVDPIAAATWIRASLHHAWADPRASQAYVLHHAQEMQPEVVAAHIKLYVNELTDHLGESGYAAVRGLLHRSAQAGLVPPVADAALTSRAGDD